uniref:nucleolar complex protein 2 homolog n=1 Tax=Myxine glutinosa TaxID=7769 RepID=UPI00358F8885
MAPTKRLAELSVEEFFALEGSSNDEGRADGEDVIPGSRQRIRAVSTKRLKNERGILRTKNKKDGTKSSLSVPSKRRTKEEEGDEGEAREHAKQLEQLKSSDPEFYNFLQKNDSTLLDFDPEEGADDSDDSESGVHKPPEQLEEPSDSENDDVNEEEKPKVSQKSQIIVTTTRVDRWRSAAMVGLTQALLHDVVGAFGAAVANTQDDEDAKLASRFKVEGSSVFNSLILFCLRDFQPTLDALLRFKTEGHRTKLVLPSSTTRWKGVRHDVRTYLGDVLQLLAALSEGTVVCAVLRHIRQLVPYFLCFPKISRQLLKHMVRVWSEGADTARVVAFLVLNRVCRERQDLYLASIIKIMYLGYVRNVKFTSPDSMPVIGFMQRSFAEVCGLNPNAAYPHAFLYIRQLAIHLRNATVVRKRENLQAVYNWQFIHCLELWSRVLSALYEQVALQPLVYPLVQVICGTVRLIPTARYYPLRFHCVRALNLLTASTGIFIPTLPFLMEVFEDTDFNRRPSRVSVRPINFSVTLKLSKANLQEKAFRDGLLDQLYDLIMESLIPHAYSISFTELILPITIQLRRFLSSCKIGRYKKQVRQLLEKLEENSNFLSRRRNGRLGDSQSMDAWEEQMKTQKTPLMRYYELWRKLRDREIQLEISGKERLDDTSIPSIRRKPQKAGEKERKEFSELFPSDDEHDDDGDDDDDDVGLVPKDKRRKESDDEEGSRDSSDGSLTDEDEEENEVLDAATKKVKATIDQEELAELVVGGRDNVENLTLSDDEA